MVRFEEQSLMENLDPAETAVIVVDMMNEFVEEGAILETPAAREMAPRLKDVIDRSRDAGASIVYLKQRNRQTGADAGGLSKVTPEILTGEAHTPGEQTDIYDAVAPAPEDTVVEKQTYSGFFQTEMDSILRSLDVSTVVITGVATHICCDSTMRDAFFRGYDVVVLSDCNATFDIADQGWGDLSAEAINRVWFTVVSSNFGDVLDSESFLDMLETSPENDEETG